MRITAESINFPTPRGFIVLDGVNGAGKSTLQKRLAAYLESQHFRVLCTYEPGDSALGRGLRTLLLEQRVEPIHPEAEMFLFSADRRQHVARVIEPALQAGTIVLSDRYYYSTAAFQGYGRGLDLNKVAQVNALAISGCIPDLVLLLDLDPREGLRRTGRRSISGEQPGKDTFEDEEIAFHDRLRQGFLEIAENAKEPFLVLDAKQGPEVVFTQALGVVNKLIPLLRPDQA